jgi:VanZ family protein
MRERILGLICAVVLCVTLAAGLAPFRRPRNKVTWLGNQDGVRFARYGTLFSSGTFHMPGPPEQASSSIEIWLQPARLTGSYTLLSFSTPENPVQLSFKQYLSDFEVRRQVQSDPRRNSAIWIDGLLRKDQPFFITVTSGPRQTAIYVDGVLASRFPQFRLGNDLAGQLVLGTSPVADDAWYGQIKGLAIYPRELTAAQVLSHQQTWTTRGRPELSANDSATALYLFDERGGSVVHDAAGSGIDLYIPAQYSLLHHDFLTPFWKEFRRDRGYVKDTLVNIVGLMPLGFIFCAYWSLARPIKRATPVTVALGLAVSLTIEILQAYLPTRNSGTTDLITNTFGTFLGVALFRTRIGGALIGKLYQRA